MTLKATNVFVPGAFPTHTYIERKSERLEQRLRDAADTPGQIVSLSGPSKCGKTVLVEKVVGVDGLITVSGAGITSVDDIWNRVLDWMDVPASSSSQSSVGGTIGGSAELKGSASAFGLAKASAGGALKADVSGELANSESRERRGLTQVADVIASSEYVVLVDDFHYMPRDIQEEAAKSLKEAVRLGVKIITASVRHRGDDVVRANPELRGRVHAVDMDYWAPAELEQIGLVGFSALNVTMPAAVLKQFVTESAGSPQLMQSICLQTCFELGVRERAQPAIVPFVGGSTVDQILERTSATTNFRSLIDVLDSGPKTRGTERKTYKFKDGTEGDVYRCVLKAMAANPPKLAFKYDDLLQRTVDVCRSESPVGSSVTTSCQQMSRLALDRFPSERVLDWDEQKQILDLPDPYLLFYLRWSGRLKEQDV